MIAREWRGRVPPAKADAYRRLMLDVALPDYRATPGNCGAWCLTREVDGLVEFAMLTFWRDFEAIRGFAGEDPEAAKYYDFDPDFLVEMAPRVTHFAICTGD